MGARLVIGGGVFESARGGLLGFAVGDALGWPVEPRGNRVGGTMSLKPELAFHKWVRREGGRNYPHQEPMPAGVYSDDTQLTLAVARSLRHSDWWEHLTRVELPWWSQYELGGGGAVQRSAKAWAKGGPPWRGQGAGAYWGAGGNGAAMRMFAHCAVPNPGFDEVRARVLADGAATHGHPAALLGAQLYAYAVWITMRRREPLGWGQLLDEVLSEADGWARLDPARVPEDWAGHLPEDYPELWGRVAEQLLDSLQLARNEIAHGALALDEQVLRALGAFSKESGAGTVTAAAVLYLASRHAAEPHQGLLQAAFARGADTDTLAAMTSALLGVVHGSDWLGPLAGQVMDSELISRTAARLADFDHADRSTEPYTAGARRHVESALAGALAGASMALPFYGQVTILDVRDLDNRTTRIRSWWMRNADGQTFRIKRFSKAKRSPWIERPRSQAPAPASAQGNGHPRTGLVVSVSDLERSRHFYETVIGMPVTRRTRLAIGLAGWLALEPASSLRAASTDSRAGLGTRAAITVYTDLAGISAAERRLAETDANVTVGKTDRGPVLRTVDPDGIPIEIRVA